MRCRARQSGVAQAAATVAALAACSLATLLAPEASAAPFTPEPFHTPPASEANEDGLYFRVDPEYRVRVVHIEPLDVNGTRVRAVSWAEQRLRLDVTMSRPGIGSIFIQADILDGVLLGDNGRYGVEPSINSGLGLASKYPNLAGWEVGLVDGGNALQIDDYGTELRSIEPIRFNYLYGEVKLPFGLLRVGRQPTTETGAMSVNDGRSHRNRWGVSRYHQAADRILFGTSISEIARFLDEGDEYVPDPRLDRGVTLGLVYDFLVEDDLADYTDDLHMVAAQLAFAQVEEGVKGQASATLVYRWDERYDTSVFVLPVRAGFSLPCFDLRAEFSLIAGRTREVSEGFSALTKKPVVDQDLLSWGSRIIADWHVGDFTFTGEWAYASGDADPRPDTVQSAYTWPRDTNLGLLLFEHVLSFQSARSAAVGITVLEDHEADTFPLTEVSTEGRVTNVNALFPQVFWEPVDGLLLKAGVLMAWSATDIVDPIQSNLAWDGDDIEDDLVNYVGGKPSNYWGTEFDLGVRYRYRDFFEASLEAAWLLPGPGLEDENGDAVSSYLVETRFTFSL